MNKQAVTLAQELHDGIAQDLVGLGYCIDSCLSDQSDLQIRNQLRELRFTVDQILEKVRTEIHQLRKNVYSDSIVGQSTLNYELNRVFSEIIRNVEHHSKASLLEITVTDNGVGGVEKKTDSFGLIGIQERVEKLNGVILIESTPGRTRICINIPLGG